MGDLGVWEISENGERHWVVAADESDAIKVLIDSGMVIDFKSAEDFVATECPGVTRLSDDKMFGVDDEDLGGKLSKSCRGWAEDEGRGYLAGTMC